MVNILRHEGVKMKRMLLLCGVLILVGATSFNVLDRTFQSLTEERNRSQVFTDPVTVVAQSTRQDKRAPAKKPAPIKVISWPAPDTILWMNKDNNIISEIDCEKYPISFIAHIKGEKEPRTWRPCVVPISATHSCDALSAEDPTFTFGKEAITVKLNHTWASENGYTLPEATKGNCGFQIWIDDEGNHEHVGSPQVLCEGRWILDFCLLHPTETKWRKK
jgi:hypothetical protein